MNLNITIPEAKAIFESACAAAEASVVAQFGEFDIFKPRHCTAYDAALFPVLIDYFRSVPIAEVLNLVG
jgi:hypothetical protein